LQPLARLAQLALEVLEIAIAGLSLALFGRRLLRAAGVRKSRNTTR
jgi:hypothetical protein